MKVTEVNASEIQGLQIEGKVNLEEGNLVRMFHIVNSMQYIAFLKDEDNSGMKIVVLRKSQSKLIVGKELTCTHSTTFFDNGLVFNGSAYHQMVQVERDIQFNRVPGVLCATTTLSGQIKQEFLVNRPQEYSEYDVLEVRGVQGIHHTITGIADDQWYTMLISEGEKLLLCLAYRGTSGGMWTIKDSRSLAEKPEFRWNKVIAGDKAIRIHNTVNDLMFLNQL